jgi:hypothetical protein
MNNTHAILHDTHTRQKSSFRWSIQGKPAEQAKRVKKRRIRIHIGELGKDLALQAFETMFLSVKERPDGSIFDGHCRWSTTRASSF